LHGNRPPSDLDSTPTATTTRCNMYQVRVAGSRHRLDRRRQKNGVSDRKQGRRRPEANITAPVQQRPVQKKEADSDKDAVTHGRRYAKYVRPTTPSNNFRGYSHSPLSNSSLNSATNRSPFSTVHNSVTILHRFQLYFVSVTTVHCLTKTVSRRTFTSPLTHVRPYCTTLSGHLVQVSH